MALYPQPKGRRPSVEYIPGPYDGTAAAPSARGRRVAPGKR